MSRFSSLKNPLRDIIVSATGASSKKPQRVDTLLTPAGTLTEWLAAALLFFKKDADLTTMSRSSGADRVQKNLAGLNFLPVALLQKRPAVIPSVSFA